VIVWFTKGMACVFCRQHMSQLSRAYDEIRKRDAEVLEIAPSTPEKGRLYASKYKLPFPYLCDPDDRGAPELADRAAQPRPRVVRRRAGRRHDVQAARERLWQRAAGVRRDSEVVARRRHGILHRRPRRDRALRVQRVVRDLSTGKLAIRPIPANDEILRELERCA
jgi:peroxiredoxin